MQTERMPKRPIIDEPSTGTVDNFSAGDHVAIVGLQNRRDLNGRTAFVGKCLSATHERFEVHLAPMVVDAGKFWGFKMDWADTQTEENPIVKLKATNLHGIDGGVDAAFDQLGPAEKVAVQRAQKALYELASMYKGGQRKPPNPVALFRSAQVALVREPPAGLVPPELGDGHLVVRRVLDPNVGTPPPHTAPAAPSAALRAPGTPSSCLALPCAVWLQIDGAAGVVHVVASCPRLLKSYHRELPDAGGGTALGGKPAAEAYLQAMPALYASK